MSDTKKHLWGIDLGGTKAEGVVLGSGGLSDILFRDRVPTGAENGYDHILSQIDKLVRMMESKMGYRPESLGICTPGTLDPATGTMKGCNSECMNGQPMKDDLKKLLKMNVFIANDANCFALAEARMGVVKEKYPNATVVFGVIMGTGVGGGLVVDGRVINGLHGIGGEWGHNFLDESGGPCYCGKSGCVEKVLSGPSLERYYFSVTGEKKSLKEIYTLYKQGDKIGTQTIQRMSFFFGKAISVITNIIDPDVIVIGGGVGNIDEIYTDGVASLKNFIFNDKVVSTPIVKPMLGDSAGVFGAAYLTI
ncbi:MAG: ROK family protein [Cyclobacteriaceae bacterium]|nr:ROK family protein [Cyclobacteriaceae bacterium]